MKMRLLAKMLLLILLPTCIGFGVLAAVSDTLASRGMRKQIDEDLRLLVEVQAREMDNIVGLLRSTTVNLGNSEHVVEYLEALKQGKADNAVTAAARETLDGLVTNYPRIQAVGLMSLDGVMVLHTNSKVQGANMANRQYFIDVMQQGKTVIFDDYSDVLKTFVFLIATPVRVNNQTIGVALVDVDLAALTANTTDKVRVAKTGFCFFYSTADRIISHPDKTIVGQDQSNLAWVREVLSKPKGMLNYEWRGLGKVAYFERVPNTGWTVVIGVEEADLMTPITEMSLATLILALIITLAVGATIFFISRNMAKVLRGSAGLSRFVAEGNFTLTPEYTQQLARDCRRSDEIGDLSQALQRMIASLSELFTSSSQKTREAEIATAKAEESLKQAEEATRRAESAKRDGMLAAAAELEGSVAVITAASTQLAAQIEQSRRGSEEQASRITSTATAMEEMNSTVLEVARNASQASEASARTRQKADAGSAVVKQAVDAIRIVQQQSQKLKADMNGLDSSAQAINQIMGVISDIADQTNLLALNAAIEAARAGEAGRGFAVVADEVRKLAEKTMASTTDVGNAIRSIQQSASQSISQVDMAMKTIDEATRFANESGESLKEIVDMVDNSADQVRSIATASEQQSATSEEINNAIAQVNSIASDTARAMRESATAVNDLAKQAQVLNNLIENMKRTS